MVTKIMIMKLYNLNEKKRNQKYMNLWTVQVNLTYWIQRLTFVLAADLLGSNGVNSSSGHVKIADKHTPRFTKCLVKSNHISKQKPSFKMNEISWNVSRELRQQYPGCHMYLDTI